MSNPFDPPPRRTSLLWIAVDFDGTLASSHYDPDHPTYKIGEPVPGALEKCKAIVDAGYKIIVHTARPSSDYELVESWLLHYGFPFKQIYCGKLLAVLYVDDRARHADAESWLP